MNLNSTLRWCFRQAYLPYFLLSQNVKDHFINKDSIVFSSIKAEVKPDFANAMSVQTECRTWKLVFESYAEVQPDFAYAMSVQTECRATRAGSQKLCWGEAWLRNAMSVQTECRTWKLIFESYAEVKPDFATQCQCKPNAELENSFSKVMLRCSLTSRMQRYNLNTPKSKFFRHLISHPYFFKQLYKAPNPFIYKHFRAFLKRKKKNEIGIYHFIAFRFPKRT